MCASGIWNLIVKTIPLKHCSEEQLWQKCRENSILQATSHFVSRCCYKMHREHFLKSWISTNYTVWKAYSIVMKVLVFVTLELMVFAGFSFSKNKNCIVICWREVLSSKTVYSGKFISRFKHVGEVCLASRKIVSGLGYSMPFELMHL